MAFLFFGTLVVAVIVDMAKIQRAEAAIEAERKRQARLAEFSAKCFRPDGD